VLVVCSFGLVSFVRCGEPVIYFNIINFSGFIIKGIKSFITFSVLPSAVVLFAWALKPV
jgi:hypothetical protein